MSNEAFRPIEKQLVFPLEELAPLSVAVSASRRTEMPGLKPQELVRDLQKFQIRNEIHSVVLWTKDPTNIYEHKNLREELSKHNLMVFFTLTGLGGTRIEPTVPSPEILLARMPKLMEFLKDPRRLQWRFDPIVTLENEKGKQWSSSENFGMLAREMAKYGVDNCYFSFVSFYPKFRKRKLKDAEITMVNPRLQEQIQVVSKMKEIAEPLGIQLYSCAQPLLENIPGIIPAKCIDGEFLTELHPQKKPADTRPDSHQQSNRPSCYCTKSIDIGDYDACGHGCVYCYAEAAVPPPSRLRQKPMPWEAQL